MINTFSLPFSADIYYERRQHLLKNVSDKKIVLLGNFNVGMNFASNTYHFRQDSSVLYFSGLEIHKMALVLNPFDQSTTLYANEFSLNDIIWTGPVPSLDQMASSSGITKIKPFNTIFSDIKSEPIHFLPSYRGDHTIFYQQLLNISVDKISMKTSRELCLAIRNQRIVKSEEEIKQIEVALCITKELHEIFLNGVMVGNSEHHLVGAILQRVKEHHASMAYNIILSKNGHILHNHHHCNTFAENDLILGDIGASAPSHYAADITRTYPVGRKFSTLQRQMYQIVLDAEKKTISAMKPGVKYLDLHKLAASIIVEGLKEFNIFKGNTQEIVETGAYAIVFPHGLGHQIGLDVHDMENFNEDLIGYDETTKRSPLFGMNFLRYGREIDKGHVLTAEPGIYFIPDLISKWESQKQFNHLINYSQLKKYQYFGGIRIEDNILVTEKGHQILGEIIPKSIEEIEL